MSNTSAAVRNKWNAKNYDRINVTVPKGMRDMISRYAEGQGVTVNQLINTLLASELRIQWEEWGFAVGENPYMNRDKA